MTSHDPTTLETLFSLSDESSQTFIIHQPHIFGFAESEWMKLSNDAFFEATGIVFFHMMGNHSLRILCPDTLHKVSESGTILPIEALKYELIFEQKILITMQDIVLKIHRSGEYGEITNVAYRLWDLWLPSISSWMESCNDLWLKNHTENLCKGNLWQRIVAAGLLCHRIQDKSQSIHNLHDPTSPRQLALHWSASWSAKSRVIVKEMLLAKLNLLLKNLHILDSRQNIEDPISNLCKLVKDQDDIKGITILLDHSDSIPPEIQNLCKMCNHMGSKILKKYPITIEHVYNHKACTEQVLRAWIALTWHA